MYWYRLFFLELKIEKIKGIYNYKKYIKKMPSLDGNPILLLISLQADLDTFSNLACVCKRFNDAVYGDYWKMLFQKHGIKDWNYQATCGNLRAIKWLHENRSEGCTRNTMDCAASNGHLKVVKWLHENGKGCTTEAMNWAAMNGHLDVIKWLNENRSEGCNFWAIYYASIRGHLKVEKWLHQVRALNLLKFQ